MLRFQNPKEKQINVGLQKLKKKESLKIKTKQRKELKHKTIASKQNTINHSPTH